MRVAVLPRLAVVTNVFPLETALSQATDFANMALAALRMRSVCWGSFSISVLKIGVSAMAAYRESGKSVRSFSSAAIFFSGSAILVASS